MMWVLRPSMHSPSSPSGQLEQRGWGRRMCGLPMRLCLEKAGEASKFGTGPPHIPRLWLPCRGLSRPHYLHCVAIVDRGQVIDAILEVGKARGPSPPASLKRHCHLGTNPDDRACGPRFNRPVYRVIAAARARDRWRTRLPAAGGLSLCRAPFEGAGSLLPWMRPCSWSLAVCCPRSSPLGSGLSR